MVVNAAEGEPGSFKDRAIIRPNPYAIVEGAAGRARCLGADQLIIGTKRTFTREIALLHARHRGDRSGPGGPTASR